jgi:hypothetical protein
VPSRQRIHLLVGSHSLCVEKLELRRTVEALVPARVPGGAGTLKPPLLGEIGLALNQWGFGAIRECGVNEHERIEQIVLA